MEINCDEGELQEIIKFNGQTVSNALAMLKNNATEREISDYISNYTGQPHNLVTREVNEILHFAVSNGFLVKNGSTFSLPNQNNIYQLDCDASRSVIDESGEIDVRSDSSDDDVEIRGTSRAESISLENAMEEKGEVVCVDDVEEEG